MNKYRQILPQTSHHLFLQRRILFEDSDQGAFDGFVDLMRTAFNVRTEGRIVDEDVFLNLSSLTTGELFHISISALMKQQKRNILERRTGASASSHSGGSAKQSSAVDTLPNSIIFTYFKIDLMIMCHDSHDSVDASRVLVPWVKRWPRIPNGFAYAKISIMSTALCSSPRTTGALARR